jgi:hypothetical protein
MYIVQQAINFIWLYAAQSLRPSKFSQKLSFKTCCVCCVWNKFYSTIHQYSITVLMLNLKKDRSSDNVQYKLYNWIYNNFMATVFFPKLFNTKTTTNKSHLPNKIIHRPVSNKNYAYKLSVRPSRLIIILNLRSFYRLHFTDFQPFQNNICFLFTKFTNKWNTYLLLMSYTQNTWPWDQALGALCTEKKRKIERKLFKSRLNAHTRHTWRHHQGTFQNTNNALVIFWTI